MLTEQELQDIRSFHERPMPPYFPIDWINGLLAHIEALQQRIAALEAQERLKVSQYVLQRDETLSPTTLDLCINRDGIEKWAIRRRGFCLSSDFVFEYEPQPSSRDDSFLERCRFDTVALAVDVWERYLSETGQSPTKTP